MCVFVGICSTKRDAERELARLVNEVQTGTYVPPSRLTVAAYLDTWTEEYARSQVSAKTLERYEEIVRCHLAPALGHHLLDDLKPIHIQAYYTRALRAGRRDGRGGLAPLTVRHHHRVLCQALEQAVRWQFLVRNPANGVQAPRVQRRAPEVLDEKQTAQLLRAVHDSTLLVPVTLAATTGLRRGEILALQWRDIDFSAGSLRVRRTLEETRLGRRFKEPKSAKSRRVVSLPTLTLDALRSHRAEQARIRLMVGPAYADHDLVCPRAHDGEPLAPRSLTHAFTLLMRRLPDLPRIRFHDLRHSHASHLLRQNVHPKIVSERLGHAAIGITRDVYSHVLPGLQEEAARQIDGALRQAASKPAARQKM